MTATATIIDRLNTLSRDTSTDWWGGIAAEFDLDDDAIAAADSAGRSDVIVLMDGRWFRWAEHGRTWVGIDAPES